MVTGGFEEVTFPFSFLIFFSENIELTPITCTQDSHKMICTNVNLLSLISHLWKIRDIRSQSSQAVIKKENYWETKRKRKKELLENYVSIYFKILYLIMIKTQNMAKVASKLPPKDFLINILLVVLMTSKHSDFHSQFEFLLWVKHSARC